VNTTVTLAHTYPVEPALRFDMTRNELKSLLHYCPEAGNFIWLKRRGGSAIRGSIAGSLTDEGYIRLSVFGKAYLAHRLAWFYVYGNWPLHEIDHIDNNRTNNSINNLRLASDNGTAHNASLRSDNTSGFKGVSRTGNKWRAIISANGVTHNLGSFKYPEQAHDAYCLAGKLLHGKFFNPGL